VVRAPSLHTLGTARNDWSEAPELSLSPAPQGLSSLLLRLLTNFESAPVTDLPA